jgi:hypothetical protein
MLPKMDIPLSPLVSIILVVPPLEKIYLSPPLRKDVLVAPTLEKGVRGDLKGFNLIDHAFV